MSNSVNDGVNPSASPPVQGAAPEPKAPPILLLGRRFVVAPTGVEPPLAADRLLLRIDAGGAFGSGAHPTTQLCLRALERHLTPGAPVADIGAGTGILAIAAARLGAQPILAVDLDPEAVRVAQANILANGVEAQVRVQQGSIGDVLAAGWERQPRAWVVANILANVIDALFAQGLADAVGEGGWLVISGVMRPQTPQIRANLYRAGLEFLAQEQQGEWVCLLARRA